MDMNINNIPPTSEQLDLQGYMALHSIIRLKRRLVIGWGAYCVWVLGFILAAPSQGLGTLSLSVLLLAFALIFLLTMIKKVDYSAKGLVDFLTLVSSSISAVCIVALFVVILEGIEGGWIFVALFMAGSAAVQLFNGRLAHRLSIAYSEFIGLQSIQENEHRHWAPKVVDWATRDTSVRHYHNQVAEQGRMLTVAECLMFEKWMSTAELRSAEAERDRAFATLRNPFPS